MRSRRRTNLLWGLALLALALILLLRALQILPQPLFDLLARAWPALLILAGLSILLRARVGFGSGIALLISAALVVGIAALGFSNRAAQQRDDYKQSLDQNVADSVTLLRLQIHTLATDVEVLPRQGAERQVTGQFVGSLDSMVEFSYDEEGVEANLTVTEQQASQFPNLDTIGRGALHLELPPDLPLDIEVQAADGSVSMNMVGLSVERMNLDLQHGNALVTLPHYMPVASAPGDLLGTLIAHQGDLTLLIDLDIAAQLDLDVGVRPQYDPNYYNYLSVSQPAGSAQYQCGRYCAALRRLRPRRTGHRAQSQPVEPDLAPLFGEIGIKNHTDFVSFGACTRSAPGVYLSQVYPNITQIDLR